MIFVEHYSESERSISCSPPSSNSRGRETNGLRESSDSGCVGGRGGGDAVGGGGV